MFAYNILIYLIFSFSCNSVNIVFSSVVVISEKADHPGVVFEVYDCQLFCSVKAW